VFRGCGATHPPPAPGVQPLGLLRRPGLWPGHRPEGTVPQRTPAAWSRGQSVGDGCRVDAFELAEAGDEGFEEAAFAVAVGGVADGDGQDDGGGAGGRGGGAGGGGGACGGLGRGAAGDGDGAGFVINRDDLVDHGGLGQQSGVAGDAGDEGDLGGDEGGVNGGANVVPITSDLDGGDGVGAGGADGQGGIGPGQEGEGEDRGGLGCTGTG